MHQYLDVNPSTVKNIFTAQQSEFFLDVEEFVGDWRLGKT
jgi:hypothetical protein